MPHTRATPPHCTSADPAVALLLLLRCFLLTCNCLTLTFTGTAVSTGTLTTQRKTFTVTQTTITSDIHEALNVHLHFRTQLTFNLELTGEYISDSSLLIIVPVSSFLIEIDTCFCKDVLSSAWANTINVGKSFLTMFFLRKINPS